MINPVTCILYFHFFEALTGGLKFYTIPKTLITWKAMQLRFLNGELKTLPFKFSIKYAC